MVYKKQNGFTLVELLVSLAILGFVSAAMAMTFDVVTKTSTVAMGQNRALSEVHTAGSWISRDVVSSLANTVQPTSGNTLCSMQSYVWNSSTQAFELPVIKYQIINGILTRKIGSNPALQVAQFIDGAATTFTCADNTTKYFTLTVRSEYNGTSVTEVYKMKQVLTQ
jgi:prepilin-type N-terminal cleavage/methylation domain-containing protein